MTESQYSDYKNLSRHSLGLMSNEIWHRDPKMLGIHLARYKFVAKMLAGKKYVAEIGCGDGFYSKVVAHEIPNLYLYDFDPQFKQHNSNILIYDILDGALPHKPLQAIYSLDCMEHIRPEYQGTYLRNVAASLEPNGVFVVGMPSLESQAYASSASKIGHVNCKPGDDLKAALERYFHNVFMFGMSDETIHTGFYPMCHYLMAVCCGVR